MNKAVFLDRDGAVNKILDNGEHASPHTPEEFEFLPKAPEAINAFNNLGFKVFIMTNQPDISKGALTEENLRAIHQKMTDGIEAAGGRIDGIYYCPHPEGSSECMCKKPKTGLFENASRKHNIDPSKSYMMGDRYTDILVGKRFGCHKTFLVTSKDTEKSRSYVNQAEAVPDYEISGIYEAVEIIRTLEGG
jgi:histidinol-phosphate phosphatase family protein